MSEKKHALYNASGSERWLNCAASIPLSKGLPDLPTTLAAGEGTIFHSYCERVLKNYILTGKLYWPKDLTDVVMLEHLKQVVNFVLSRWHEQKQTLLLEEKADLTHIHESMYGTGDIVIYELNGLLQVWDIKYGKGHVVEVEHTTKSGLTFLNSQIVFYALGVAHKFNYKFKKVLLGVIQPRIKHPFGTERYKIITIDELRRETDTFKRGVERTLRPNPKPFSGEWCYFCKAKTVCPLKQDIKIDKLKDMFSDL